MRDLQTALLVIGACVVVAVYAFNWWQERQFKRRTELAFEREHTDVLMPGSPLAPDDQPRARIEPRLDTSAAPAATVIDTPARVSQAAEIDSVIDFVVDVSLPAPASSAALRLELTQLSTGWDKPVLVAACDEATGQWEATPADGRDAYSQWRFAVQMSNRAGCIDHGRLAAFYSAVAKWADSAGADGVKSIDTGLAHSMAMQLDRFCADVDIAIGINVVTRGNPFTGTQVRALAEASGLKLESDGVFYLRNDAGRKIYTLDNHEPMPFVPEQMNTLETSGVTFLLDVPCVAEGVGAFERMLATARTFASTLDGSLVDDNRRTLTDDAIDKIRRQLTGILAKMEAGQIAAGGTRALRLFS